MKARAAILAIAKQPLRRVPVTVPGIAAQVFVREMTTVERDEFELHQHDLNQSSGRRHVRATMIAHTACDEAGARIFSDADIEQIAALPASSLEPMAEAAFKLNGLTAADQKTLEGNSPAPETDDGSNLN